MKNQAKRLRIASKQQITQHQKSVSEGSHPPSLTLQVSFAAASSSIADAKRTLTQ
jgi:hypothetical protein